MTTYTTQQGDTIDAIAWAECGDDGYALDLLRANPGLADRGPILPAGIEVRLPDRVTAPAVSQIRLWGKEA
jgi:phage tail protein X